MGTSLAGTDLNSLLDGATSALGLLSDLPTLPASVQSVLATAVPESELTRTDLACIATATPDWYNDLPSDAKSAISSYETALSSWYSEHSSDWQFLRTFLSHVLRRLVAGLRLLLVEAQMPHLLQRAGQEMLLRLELRLLLLLVLPLWLQALLVLQVCWVLWWLCKSWPRGSVKSWCTKGIWKELGYWRKELFKISLMLNMTP